MNDEMCFTGFDKDTPMVRIYFTPAYESDSIQDNQLVRFYICPSCETDYLLRFAFEDDRAADMTAKEMLDYNFPCDRCRMGVSEGEYQERLRSIVSAQEQLAGVMIDE